MTPDDIKWSRVDPREQFTELLSAKRWTDYELNQLHPGCLERAERDVVMNLGLELLKTNVIAVRQEYDIRDRYLTRTYTLAVLRRNYAHALDRR